MNKQKYFLTVERPENSEDGKEATISYGFKKEGYAKKFGIGDKIVNYVSNGRGFSIVMKVETWDNGKIYKYDNKIAKTGIDYPWRLKVKVLCEITDPERMPKWKDFRPNLHWCNTPGISEDIQKQNLTLHTTLLEIDKHDYDMIKKAICSVALAGVLPTPK